MHLPVGGRVGIVALRDRRVLALVVFTVDNGLVAHIEALAGPACGGQHGARAALRAAGACPRPRAAVARLGHVWGHLATSCSSSAGVLLTDGLNVLVFCPCAHNRAGAAGLIG